ncbi:unnamed protein product [Kuraishia capsulata CBS 1993]|uniref:glucan 1,4-alpha-glucosidase n=1 Tax=Kuraishia capsulata CBS 1993 TaxID=1382522 RepID=W6MTC8_9ASCO|nr:uncharacterized protein KUCA_T00004434001 [Kuraishia capsulata CBS 1993]CDK28452.1 unnamed protein product [Kuraishia capsulata CBS 1993]
MRFSLFLLYLLAVVNSLVLPLDFAAGRAASHESAVQSQPGFLQLIKEWIAIFSTREVASAIPRGSFESWLQEQEKISFESILQNIGGYGEFAQNVSIGAVIASPSQTRPNYFYQWTRDSALTVMSLVEYLDDHELQDYEFGLCGLVESYIENQYHVQRLANPSGTFEDLTGLGEPKFMANGEAFVDHWGRPQRDGPGLRVITVLGYLSLLTKYEGNFQHEFFTSHDDSFRFVYDEIVKPDLQYIVHHWASPGFDLWEEVNSLHLFTSLTQLKALKLGMTYALAYSDSEFYAVLTTAYNALNFFIQVDSGYKTGNLPFLIETPTLLLTGKRIGLDIASILASLRAHDVDDVGDALDIPFAVDDPVVLNTLTAMVNDMKYRYPINHNRLGFGTGFALGRYPEDVYDGYGTTEGNPWFIATASASELVYKILYKLYKYENDLYIPIGLREFYQPFFEFEIKQDMVVPFGSDEFHMVADGLIKYADSFMDVIREHVDNNGHMSEQFNKYSGFMEGAEDLTWSYSSCWSSMRWRNKVVKLMERS